MAPSRPGDRPIHLGRRELLAALASAGAGVARAATTRAATAGAFDALAEPIGQALQAQHIPGAAVAIVPRDGVPWIRCFGQANLEHQVAVHEQTIFQSGSVGKQFVAALCLLLAEAGRLSLDDRVSRWGPVPAAWRRMTLRHLLSHTSGLPEDPPASQQDLRRDLDDARLWRLVTGLPLRSLPGARWSYSNAGYVLLGLLIGRITGRFYGDELATRVFGPAGMATARVIDDTAIVANRAAGYLWQAGAWRHHDWVSATWNRTADGSLHLSILDLVAWDRVMRGQTLLSPRSWQLAWAPVRLLHDGTAPYGLGWMLDPQGSRRRIHHDGQWQGYTSWLGWYPEEGLSVALLTNLGDADPLSLGEMIAARAAAPDQTPRSD